MIIFNVLALHRVCVKPAEKRAENLVHMLATKVPNPYSITVEVVSSSSLYV
jgi:hypothetical protein